MKTSKPVGYYLLILGIWLLSLSSSYAQIYVVVDKYTAKRHRLTVGNEFHFRLAGEKLIRHDIIVSLSMEDSTIGLAKAATRIKLKDIAQVYFYHGGVDALQVGGLTLATGFLTAAAVHPLVDNAQYDARESATIGIVSLVVTQMTRIFRRSSIKIGDRGRIRIIEIKWEDPYGDG